MKIHGYRRNWKEWQLCFAWRPVNMGETAHGDQCVTEYVWLDWYWERLYDAGEGITFLERKWQYTGLIVYSERLPAQSGW